LELIEKTKTIEGLFLKSLKKDLEPSLNQLEMKSVDEVLKEMEETLRNPRDLIESIREMQLKHEKSIEIIQLKLNNIKRVQETLKASNEFQPNSFLHPDSFGQLNLNENLIYDPFKSSILTGLQPLDLIKVCEFDRESKFTLLYRASQDGFEASHFHSKCDGKANTLTLLRASETSFIFGGFTTATWESFQPGQWKSDPNAFLFSLKNKDEKPCKMKIDASKHVNAIICNSKYGPIFGVGNGNSDFSVASKANTSNGSYSNLGYTYKHPKYSKGSNEARSFLAGSKQFQVEEIEVFHKLKIL